MIKDKLKVIPLLQILFFVSCNDTSEVKKGNSENEESKKQDSIHVKSIKEFTQNSFIINESGNNTHELIYLDKYEDTILHINNGTLNSIYQKEIRNVSEFFFDHSKELVNPHVKYTIYKNRSKRNIIMEDDFNNQYSLKVGSLVRLDKDSDEEVKEIIKENTKLIINGYSYIESSDYHYKNYVIGVSESSLSYLISSKIQLNFKTEDLKKKFDDSNFGSSYVLLEGTVFYIKESKPKVGYKNKVNGFVIEIENFYKVNLN